MFIKKLTVSVGVGAISLLATASVAFAGVPAINSIKVTGPNTITVVYSEAVNANAGDYSNFTIALAGRSVSSLGGNGTNTITLTLNGEPLSADSSGYVNIGTNTTSVIDHLPFPGGVFNVLDAQSPSLRSISVASADGVSAIGKLLRSFNVTFSLNEPVTSVSASMFGRPVATTGGAAGPYTITYTPNGSDTEGTVPVSLVFTDSNGNSGRSSFTLSTGASSATTVATANTITSNANSAGVLKIGDSIAFTLTPSVMQPNARVTGSYNGLPLSWYTTNGGVTYSATYIVAGGNSDQAYPLQITGVMLTDQFGVTSGPMSGTDVAKTIVGSSPSIYEMTPVPATSMTNSPSYAFNSNKAGTIRYTGDCFGQTTYAYAGANTVTFSPLSVGLHNNCTIIVTDSAGNSSNQIMVSPFTISGDATNTPLPITPITPVAPTTPVTPTTNPTASDLAAQLATLQSQLEAAMAAQKAPANKYVFTKPLDYGSSGSEVLELQNRLKSVGYLKATPNGNYGPATLAAVKAFQRANGVSPLGNVGPATRAALNR